jgi:drug/metabolite transporter (DMT)-like permease
LNKGIVASIITILIWSWPTIFITYLSEDFDVITQNLYRYAAASIFLLIYASIASPKKLLLPIKENLGSLLISSFSVFIFQIVWVEAIYLTTPTTAVLFAKLDIVFIALLSLIFLKSERGIVSSKYFILGATLALLGVAGVVLGRGTVEAEFNLGVGFLLLRCLLWAGYTISVRNLVVKVEPIIAATWVFLFATLLFLPTTYFLGDIHRVAEVPLSVNLILFGSGVLCVGMGNVANYTAIKHLGANLPALLLLITPLFTGIISYFIFGEMLTPIQIVSGLLIIFSCWLVVRKVAMRPPAPPTS